MKYKPELIDNAIDDIINERAIGFDLARVSLIYPSKENAEKVANYLLAKGYYEQYSSLIEMNGHLDLNEQFEKVKIRDKAKGYLAIAKFLPYEEMVYCQNKVIELGSGLDLVNFLLDVKDCSKLKILNAIYEKEDINAIAYVIKYVDDNLYNKIKSIGLLNKFESLISASKNNFAKNVVLERKERFKDSRLNSNILDNNKMNDRIQA